MEDGAGLSTAGRIKRCPLVARRRAQTSQEHLAHFVLSVEALLVASAGWR